ncbi:Spo0E family sporulation regulatory protein-aspartic acid phosphatase [Bacillus wiedmannii]|uniref:Spo0E family sporulation regulatory protein-aspartic acid phosphatase n=1 Tax=Bacillus wiedmannii TaxID=1890302 RepID=UPI003D99F293
MHHDLFFIFILTTTDKKHGFTQDKVISFSQELDRLLNLLIERKTKRKRFSL